MVNVGTQRIHSRNKNVNSKIKLELVNQIWFMQIPLGHIMLTSLQPVEVTSQKYAFSLAACFWLHDESFGLLLVELSFKVFGILRKKPGLREKPEVLGTYFLYRHKVLSQEILPSQSEHSREVIRPLIHLHFLQESGCNRAVQPVNVPVLLFFI